MKKILALLGTAGLTVSASATLISCGLPAHLINYSNQQKSLSELSLGIDFDDEEKNNFNYIKDKVENLIKGLNANAKNNVDYQISKIGFDHSTNKALYPEWVKVKALSGSKRLKDDFDVRIYKDVDQEIQKAGLVNEGTNLDSETVYEKIKQMLAGLGPIVKDGVDYEFKKDSSTTWSVSSIGSKSLVKLNFSFNITETFEKFNLNALQDQFADFVVGQKTREDIKTELIDLLKTNGVNIDKTVEGTDYEINGNPVDGNSEMTITAKDSSDRLSGKITIHVKMFEIGDGIETDKLNVLSRKDEIDAEVFDKLHSKLNLVGQNDFNIDINYNETSGINTGFKVSADQNSHLISGEFKFDLPKINISNFGTVIKTDELTAASSDEAIKTYVENLLNSKLVVGTDQRAKVSADDYKIKYVNPWERTIEIPLSSPIFEEFSFELEMGAFSLSAIDGSSFTVGQKDYQTFKDEIVAKINEKISNTQSYVREADLNFDDATAKQLQEAGSMTITSNVPWIVDKINIVVSEQSIAEIEPIHFEMSEIKNVSQDVLNKINQLLKDKLLNVQATNNDFEIYDQNDQLVNNDNPLMGGNYYVKASQDSKILTGKFAIIIGTYDVSPTQDEEPVSIMVRTDTQPTIDDFISKVEDKLKTFGVITKLVDETDYHVTDLTNGGKNAEKVTIESLSGSNYIKGKWSFNVDAFDLTSFDLGTEFKNPETEVYEFERKDINRFKETFVTKLNLNFADTSYPTSFNFDQDFGIYDDQGQIINDEVDEQGKSSYQYPAGQYSIKPLNEDIVKNEVKFNIVSSTLNNTFIDSLQNLRVGQKNLTEIDSLIAQAVNKSAGFDKLGLAETKYLQKNVDYEIVDENGQPKNLEQAGKTIIKPMGEDKKFITGQLDFSLRKFNLETDLTKEDIATLKESLKKIRDGNASIILIEDTLTKIVNLEIDNISINNGRDISLEFNNTNSSVEITTNTASKYIQGKVTIEIGPSTLNDFQEKFASQSFTLNDNYQTVEDYIKEKMDQIFANSLIHPKLNEDYEITGPASQTSNGTLVISGSSALVIKPTSKSKMLTGQISIEVKPMERIDKVNSPYEITGNNYFLTSKASTYTADETFSVKKPSGDFFENPTTVLDTVAEKGPIQNNEILAVSRSFLVTTRGIFLGAKLIAKPNNLVFEDIISITDKFILTTKGSWYVYGQKSSDSMEWVAKEFDDPFLQHLKSTDVLAVINKYLFITKNGVYRATTAELETTKGIHSFAKEKLPGMDAKQEASFADDYLRSNERFIVTKNGVWLIPNTQTLQRAQPFKKVDVTINNNDILSFEPTHMGIKNFGIISWTIDSGTKQIKEVINSIPSFLDNGEEIVDKSTHNYLVTTKSIYWQGTLVENGRMELTKEDIIWITDYFLVTKTRLFFKNSMVMKQGTAGSSQFVNNFNFVDKDVLYSNEQFIVLKQGIQYKSKASSTIFSSEVGFTTADSPNTKITEQTDVLFLDDQKNITGITNNFVATKKGVWYRDQGQNNDIKSYTEFGNNLTDEDFIAANDNFLVMKTKIKTLNQAKTLIADLNIGADINLSKADLLALSGPVLLLKNFGYFYYEHKYKNSELIAEISKDDIIRIGENGQLLTKYRFWAFWNNSPSLIS